MRLSKMILGTALAVMFVSPALAQEEDEKCECRSFRVGLMPSSRDFAPVVWFGSRARLGVYVRTEADAEADRIGAYIESVTTGGPADKAGIEAGDIITQLDGKSVLSGGGDYEDDESAPGHRLIELARNLERGDTVEVEFRRDGESRTVELVSGDFDGVSYLDVDEYPVRVRELMGRLRELPAVTYRGPETFAVRLGRNLPGLELVSLNPDLGEYFGAEAGVLVVSIPEDSELGLRAGDVIQSIDGREVRSPSHAMRILRSYNADEEVSFQVLRKKSRTTVNGKVPDLLSDPHIVDIERHRN